MTLFTTLKLIDRSPGVLQITMARPDVFNAFDEIMIEELAQAFDHANSRDDVQVIVLASEGKHFSAGADLKWMTRASQASVEWNLADARRLASMLDGIDTSSKPVVARIQGAAMGGGFGLVCVCDIAIASEQASFAMSEAKLGILPATIGPYVINAIGKRQARRLALTAERIDAKQALNIALVHEVVDASSLDAAVDRTVTALLANSPQAMLETKQLFAQLHIGPITEQVRELTAQTISRVRGTDEAREGFNAFLNKRPASWFEKK
jgi:methylglutaconyl-CoA hydratase